MIVGSATPPEETISLPPPDTVASMSLPPAETIRLAPLATAIDLDDATINKGTVKAIGNNAKIVMSDSDSIIGATIAGGTLLDIVSGADVQLSGTIGSGALIEVTGSALLNLLSVANSGTILARDFGSRIIVARAVVRGGAIVAQGSGSTAEIAHGAVVSGGTLLASGLGSLIKIVSGAVVNGGIAQIGNGIVEIAGSSGENVLFLSSGSGGLKIADTAGHASAFSGRVSGFGGSGHLNPKQFIDLVSVMSAGVITSSYVSANGANTSGTLFISSGGTMVAAIKMVGSYSVGEFYHLRRRRHCRDHRSDGAERGRRRARARAQLPAGRRRSAEHRVRSADDARLCRECRRHRRHFDGERRPPCREHRPPRQLHRRKLHHRR